MAIAFFSMTDGGTSEKGAGMNRMDLAPLQYSSTTAVFGVIVFFPSIFLRALPPRNKSLTIICFIHTRVAEECWRQEWRVLSCKPETRKKKNSVGKTLLSAQESWLADCEKNNVPVASWAVLDISCVSIDAK